MNLDDIKEIINLMTVHGLTEFEKEEEGVRIAIKKGMAQAPAPPAPLPAVVQSPPPAEPEIDDKCVLVKAPFVGTFYRAPSPESEPYVKVGQEISADTVLCIVEAMKVMNEIKAEVRGVVRDILVENAHVVQFGQPLFKIEKL